MKLAKGQRLITETNMGLMELVGLGREDNKVLICEVNVRPLNYVYSPEYQEDRLVESYAKFKSSDDTILLRGKLQCADALNQNGRSYPRKILEREVENYKKQFIDNKTAYGECDHPDASVVEYKNVSHIIENLWWEGDDVFGDVRILDTPSGRILKKCLPYGKIGMSSRGLGSVTETYNSVVVNEDYQIICWDAVTDPSTHGAFVSSPSDSHKIKLSIGENKVHKSAGFENRMSKLFADILKDKK